MSKPHRLRRFMPMTGGRRKYRRRELRSIVVTTVAYGGSAIYGWFSWWPLIPLGILGLILAALQMHSYLKGLKVRRDWGRKLQEQRQCRQVYWNQGRRPPRHAFLV